MRAVAANSIAFVNGNDILRGNAIKRNKRRGELRLSRIGGARQWTNHWGGVASVTSRTILWARQQIGRMSQASRRVKLFVSEAEVEFFEEMARGGVFGMMSGEKRIGAERFETIGNGGATGLFGETLAPKFRAQVKAELVDFFLKFVRAKACAADVAAIREKKDGPILHAIVELPGQFPFEFFAHLLL